MSRTAILNARGQFHDYQEQLEKSLHSDNLLGTGDRSTDDITGAREDTYLKIKIIEKALEVGMDRFAKGWTTIRFDSNTGNVEFENRYGTTIMKKDEMFQEGASQVYVSKNPK